MNGWEQNKNRGAGLVTVVIVLAVAGILLSGALWLAYTHYKSAMRTEVSDKQQSEIELCAEVICKILDQKTDLKTVEELSKNESFKKFYTIPDNVTPESNTHMLTIKVESGTLFLSPLSYGEEGSEDFQKGLRIQYTSKDGDSVSETFSFEESNGKYTFSEVNPAPFEETEGNA